jgi:hypothetical protein
MKAARAIRVQLIGLEPDALTPGMAQCIFEDRLACRRDRGDDLLHPVWSYRRPAQYFVGVFQCIDAAVIAGCGFSRRLSAQLLRLFDIRQIACKTGEVLERDFS